MSEIQKSIEEKDKGNKALQEKDYPKALEHYTNAIELDPKNHIFYSNRSSVYALLEKYDEALNDASKTLELDPKFVRGYSRKGTALFFLKRYKEAQEVFNEGLLLEPSNENFRQEQARCQSFMLAEPFLQDNVWDRLKQSKETAGFLNYPDFVQRINQIRTNPIIFNQFLQMDQRILQAFVTLSGITVQNNPSVDTEDEEPQQQPPQQTNPQQQQPPKEKASIQDDEDEDKKDIEEELRKREREEKRKKEREQKEKEEREKENQSRKEINEEEKKIYNEAQELKKKGNEHYIKKEFESAIEYYDKAAQLYPKDILFLTNKAACLVELKRFEESVQVCDQAIQTGEDMQASYESIAKAFERKGNALVKLGNYEEAITAYEKSLTNNRTQPVIKVLRTTRDKYEKKKVLDYINPELSEKEKEQGNDFFKQQNYPEAIKHYSEAILRNPKNHVLYANRSVAYLKLGAYPHALSDSEKSVELDPTYAKGWLRKGKAHHCLKQYHKALESYDNGLKHDPNNQDIQQGIVETTKAIQIQNYEGVSEEQRNRAMQDPEIQNILKDPSVQKVLQAFQTNPQEGNRLLNLNKQIKAKIEKLVQAGIISMR